MDIHMRLQSCETYMLHKEGLYPGNEFSVADTAGTQLSSLWKAEAWLFCQIGVVCGCAFLQVTSISE